MRKQPTTPPSGREKPVTSKGAATASQSLIWYYHRKNCDTCEKSQQVLSELGVIPSEQVDARAVRFGRSEALKLVRKAVRVIATKGQKLLEFDLKSNPTTDDELAAAIIGPSGFLRAPTARIGDVFVVGFHEETYRDLLAK